jgi:GT2 family glycosyltransferase/glycosyltransferase involved in cell wall biosynthesis
MRVFVKARQILRTHGFAGLLQRGSSKVLRGLRAQAAARTHQRAWHRLISLVKTGPVFFPRHEKPLVSIIVPVYNNVRLTAACLNALLRELGSIPVEVIVVDDGSTDGTAEYLESCSGIRVITHVDNHGFVQSINDGAAAARGRYLHLLNNDTIVTPGWMAPLLRTFELRDRIGAVGSQLRAPDGTISEAGAVVWKDGNAANFGRGRSAKDAAVAFPREVDYCSGASFMVRADVFRELGGLSHEFAPAYYEDVDFCFRLRSAGYHVLYQPDSVVVHFEGGTAGTDTASGAKRFQNLHCGAFAEKWRAELTKHFPADSDLLERAARRLAGKRTVLVIDSFVPFHDRSAGGRRLLAIMRLMRELDWHVIFIADDGGEYEPYTSHARKMGIEVIPHRGNALRVIRDLPVSFDVAWVSRPDLLEKCMPELRRHTTAKIIYDTVDLHYLRLQREAELTGHDNAWRAVRELEHSLARRSDCTIVTSNAEQARLALAGIRAHLVPIIEEPVQTHAAYSARHDLLFLANYTHEPNVDAATWLVTDIMPRVWQRIPNMHLTLAGAEPTPAIERLAGERVTVTGFVPDVRPLFDSARLFVAPLRFGAGMKGKIVQSLAHGLPVVTSPVGAEGIALRNEINAIVADDADSIADGILRLYTEEALWTQLSAQSREAAQQFTPRAVRSMLESALVAALEPEVQVRVDFSSSTHSA